MSYLRLNNCSFCHQKLCSIGGALVHCRVVQTASYNIYVTQQQQTLMTKLIHRINLPVSHDELIQTLYPHPDKAADWPSELLQVLVYNLNLKLSGTNLQIYSPMDFYYELSSTNYNLNPTDKERQDIWLRSHLPKLQLHQLYQYKPRKKGLTKRPVREQNMP